MSSIPPPSTTIEGLLSTWHMLLQQRAIRCVHLLLLVTAVGFWGRLKRHKDKIIILSCLQVRSVGSPVPCSSMC